MNKPQIKNFSVWARRKLIETVSYRMSLVGITESDAAEALPQSTSDLKFYDIGTGKPAEVKGNDIAYRNELVSKIGQDGYKNTVEEIAYTWFNRLIAIRFMEVNNYLPSRVRVLSSLESGKSEPDIVTDAISVAEENDFDISADEIYRLKDENKADELFGKLFEFQCRQLHDCLPELFESSENYMEMLLPVSYTDKDGIIYHLVHDIPEDDFDLEKEGQVEIIGWLYQYYNTELKDTVFAALKKNVKISKENIPAATQLFTPDWIVRYMVENSLGRLWLDGHSDCNARSAWKYYLEEAEQEKSVKAQLDEMRREYSNINPEQIKFIDPCMGSGHILVYAFDVLMQIYTSCGYSERDAAQLIIQKNLYGLDIDRRAYQLAYFALMMKARQYDRRFLTRSIKPNLAHFQGLGSVLNANVNGALAEFAQQFRDCDTYGSLTEMNEVKGLDEALDDFSGVIGMEFDKTERMMTIYKILTQKYDVVCTNPPYMGGSGMSAVLSDFVKKNYPDSKSDLFAVFIERCGQLAKANGFYAMITQHAFMFLSSYEKLREKLLQKTTVNMAHLGARAFDEIGGEVVQTTAFVNYNSHIADYKGTYVRLVDIAGENEKKELFLSGDCRHIAKQENFLKIPGAPVAYWVSESVYSAFSKTLIGDIATLCQGLTTTDNNLYVRFWHEVSLNCIKFDSRNAEEAKISKIKWFPFNKGGSYKKWFGNNELVVNYQYDGSEIKASVLRKYPYLKTPDFVVKNSKYYFQEGLTWSALANDFSIRYIPYGTICADKGQGLFASDNIKYYCSLLNSKVADLFLRMLSPTLDYNCGYVRKVPCIVDKVQIDHIDSLVDECILNAKSDWDSFETSWDFKKHPLLKAMSSAAWANENTDEGFTVRSAFEIWERMCNDRFNTLKRNEEELNRIFIDIYGLQDELTPEVEDRDVTVRKADLQREIKSLISYAVGCMFGRYSLDIEGLAYAGGEWDESKYKTFIPDKDNCIPITDDNYFSDDDIVKRFADFIEVVYGKETLEENLNFIADALGKRGRTSREAIRNYFLNDFFKDHIKIYQKRPIYWLFDSGKQNGFKALVYMHRWNADTIGNVRVEYLHKVQKIYTSELDRMQDIIDNSSDSREKAAAIKAKEKLTKQLKETKDYDASMAHLANMRIDIDLDDGVKVNYEKVQTDSEGKNLGILAKI
ncbi:BREX-1 system adenine-specific DNA-methyltransferase PglX [Huintestinicola sp.]